MTDESVGVVLPSAVVPRQPRRKIRDKQPHDPTVFWKTLLIGIGFIGFLILTVIGVNHAAQLQALETEIARLTILLNAKASQPQPQCYFWETN